MTSTFLSAEKDTSAHVYLYSSSNVAPEIGHQPIFKAQGSEENKETSSDRLDPEKESLRHDRAGNPLLSPGCLQPMGPLLALQQS